MLVNHLDVFGVQNKNKIKKDIGFFLETNNGECGFGGHFCDQRKGSWSQCLKATRGV